MNNKHRRAAWFAVAGIILVATVCGFLANRDPDPGTVAAQVLPVQTMVIGVRNSYEINQVFSGLVQARRDSVLGFDGAGRLVAVSVEEGAEVAQGQLLARLDTGRLEAQRAELAASVEQAKASLALARATLSRMEGVVKAGGVSRHELDVAREGERAARAAVELALRRIDTVDTELAKSTLYAPFSGTIIERTADEGRVVGVGEPVLRLQSGTPPEIRIGVAGRAVDELITGDTYMLEWQGRALPARLRAVLPLRAVATRTVDALFDPLDAGAGPRPGDLVSLRLALRTAERGIWLPVTALTEAERGLWGVYVAEPAADSPPRSGLDATHKLARRTVELIHQEAGRVYVRGDLTSRDQVVISGVQRVVPGQWVRIVSASVKEGLGDD